MFEYFCDAQRCFIVMELFSGGELHAKMKKAGKFSEEQARPYMKQILLAVNYMHCKGIAHRDIKPENFLIDTSDHTLKLVDFGLSIECSSK
mmetsp:Transcript_31726/g.48632  ORF Transcript_31726/g.48632 Transcript_31726/m.48632 type:complete len:91 (+) Transcript_31726:1697-1969(+)